MRHAYQNDDGLEMHTRGVGPTRRPVQMLARNFSIILSIEPQVSVSAFSVESPHSRLVTIVKLTEGGKEESLRPL